MLAPASGSVPSSLRRPTAVRALEPTAELGGHYSVQAIAEARCALRETPPARSERARIGPRIGRFACHPAGMANGKRERSSPRSRPCWRARSAAIIRSRTLAKVQHPHRRQRRRLRLCAVPDQPGVLRPSALELAIGAVVVFVWGGALLGGLLPQEVISSQGRFLGAVGGLVAAWVLARPRESAPAILEDLAGWPPTCVSGWSGPSASASS